VVSDIPHSTFHIPHSEAGFTLLEVVVTIGVVALLTVATMPLASTQINRAKIRATDEELGQLKSSLLRYYHDVYNQELGTPSQRGHLFPLATGDATADLAALERKNAVLSSITDPTLAAAVATIRERWRGPYIESPAGQASYAIDAWNTPYRYDYTPAQAICSLTSAGPDRNLATTADNVTITVNGAPAIRERIRRAKADLAVIQRAVQRYLEANGADPGTIDDLIPAYLQPSYRTDPWGKPYAIQRP
jgi:prepilin-type N-terminal cleavage/methylation domain-containing protein